LPDTLNFDNDDFQNWLQQQQVNDAAAASTVVESQTEAPDKAAADYHLANDFAKTTGQPVPPLAMVKNNQPVFQAAIDRARNTSMLSQAPVLASWISNPANAAIAKDDISGLSTMENIGQQSLEMVKAPVPAVVNFAGNTLEGTGQLLSAKNNEKARAPLSDRVAHARGLPDDQVAQLRQDIFQQGDVNPQFVQNVLSGVLSGDISIDEANAQLGPMFAPILNAASEPLQAAGQAVSDYSKTVLPARPGFENSTGRQVGNGIGSILALIGVAATAALTGGTTAAAAATGTVGALAGAGNQVQDAREHHATEDQQTQAAVGGALVGATDAIPLEGLFVKSVGKGGLAILKAIGLRASMEGGQEAVQQTLQNVIAAEIYDPNRNAFEDAWDNLKTGGIVGGLVEAGKLLVEAALPGKFHASAHAAQAAEDTKPILDNVAAQANASPTKARSPDHFRDFVEKAFSGGPLENTYVDAGKFNQYFQSIGVDPHEFLDSLAGMSSEDFDTALAGNSDLKIPMATFAAHFAGSPHESFMLDNMKLDPEGMSFSEAQEFNEQKDNLRQEAFEEAERAREDAEANRSAEEKIYDEMVSRLRIAGRSTDVATTEAILYPAFYSRMAARSGVSTEEYLQRYPLPQIGGDIPQGMQFNNIDDLNRTLAAARNRKEAPETRQSLLEFIDQHGGIDDVGGELKARNADVIKRGKGKKTLRLSRKMSSGEKQGDLIGGASEAGKKHGADSVAQAAIEAGFMGDHPDVIEYKAAMHEGREIPDITRALYESIDAELRGERQFSEAPSAAQQEAAHLDEVEKYLASLGVSLSDSDEAIRQAVEGSRQYAQAITGELRGFIAKARSVARGITEKLRISSVSPELAATLKDAAGLDVAGFEHDIDLNAIQHILKSHGDAKAELSRGGLPVSDADLEAIPDIINAADAIVTGARNRRGQDLIGYVKQMPDGTTLYLEEVRNGRKTLSAASMRKYPAGKSLDSIANTLDHGASSAAKSSGNASLASTSETLPSEIKITPLPKKGNQGPFLFQKMEVGARGMIQFPAGGVGSGQTVIRLFEQANLSTVIHETGHYFLTVMQHMAGQGETSAQGSIDTLKKWWRDNAADVANDGKRAMPDVNVTAEDVRAAIENGTTGDLMKDAAVDIGMQEQFARGFEQYVMKGEAPNIELRGAFEKMRAWMISIYRTVAGLGVKVTPEVERVFSRMIASDEQIKAASETTGETGPVFTTAEQMGLTDKDFERFMKLRERAQDEAKSKLLKEAMEPIKREQEKAYKEEKKRVRADVEKEVNGFRYYRALEWMANRRWIDPDGIKEMPDIRLSKDILVERYGAGILETLPRGKQTIYAVEGGHDPEDVAGSFGFDSGDQMIKELEQAPKRKDAIDAETELRMRELHGDVLNDGSAEAQALDAVHNDRKAEWLAAELRAVSEVAGVKVDLTAKGARLSAIAALARSKVRDAISSQRYLAAERKAGDEAAKLGARLARDKVYLDAARRKIANTARAAIRGEGSPEAAAAAIDTHNSRFDTTQSTFTVAEQQRVSSTGKAYTIPGGERTVTHLGHNEVVAKYIDAKRRQLLNHALYQESRKIAAEVEKAENYVERLGKKSLRDKIGGAGRRDNAQIDYLAAIDDILDKYDFRQLSQADEARRGALLRYVQAMKDAGRENELAIPDVVLINAGRVPYKSVAVEELRGAVDSLKQLEHVALRWNKLIDAVNEREFDETVAGVVNAFETNMPKRPPGRVATSAEGFHNGVRQYLNLTLNATTLLREIDGFEDQGAAHTAIKAPIDEAVNRLTERKAKAADDLEKLYNVYSKEERRSMARRTKVDWYGEPLSKWEVISIALNTGNEGNRQRLTDRRVGASLTDDQVNAALASLDQRDAKFVQSVWDYIGTFWPEIQERERRTTGVKPEGVEGSPVTIGGIELKGGYYPLKYDSRLSSLVRDDQTQELAQAMKGGRFTKAQTRNGHTKERAQSSGRPIELDMSVLHRHINQVSYD
jgi:hypothetical protein